MARGTEGKLKEFRDPTSWNSVPQNSVSDLMDVYNAEESGGFYRYVKCKMVLQKSVEILMNTKTRGANVSV